MFVHVAGSAHHKSRERADIHAELLGFLDFNLIIIGSRSSGVQLSGDVEGHVGCSFVISQVVLHGGGNRNGHLHRLVLLVRTLDVLEQPHELVLEVFSIQLVSFGICPGAGSIATNFIASLFSKGPVLGAL